MALTRQDVFGMAGDPIAHSQEFGKGNINATRLFIFGGRCLKESSYRWELLSWT